MNPDIEDSIQRGECVTTIYLTAGDVGRDQIYWRASESGIQAAYAAMAHKNNNWEYQTPHTTCRASDGYLEWVNRQYSFELGSTHLQARP